MAVSEHVAEAKKAQPQGGGSGKEPGKDDKPTKSSLYAEYNKVQPRKISGFFRTTKNWLAVVLLGIYVIGPWLRWERAGNAPDQAILLDMAGRKGYIFGVEIWPQEIYYLTGLLILGAIGLFFVTSLLGRIWCGFTCIQTVFTDVFVMVERWIEGDRPHRIALDKGPMTVQKLWKKSAKNVIWLAISFITGWTWVLYFVDAPSYTQALITEGVGDTVSWGGFGFALIVAGFTYVLAGFAREQVCIYMCPWPRFQASMTDEDSLIITYERWRGEPRGGARKGMDFTGRGHCVDCGLCVQVCPTGIDIRDGSQLACIGCGLCIDACNSVMTRFGLPGNLISYDSNANLVAREHGHPTGYRFVRPRTIIYAVLLTAVVAVMAVSLSLRSRTEINVLHERSPLYVSLSDGSIRNGYTFKILNMEARARTFTLSTAGVEGAVLRVVGIAETDVPSVELQVDGDTVGTYRIYVTAKPAALDGKATDLDLKLIDKDTGETIEHETLFAGPG